MFTAQASLLRDRISSGKQAATSSVSSSSSSAAPAYALFAPLQQSISSPLESLQELYSLAVVADPKTRISKEQQEFNLQFGHALRTLREDIPHFFRRQQDLDIFTEDVVFLDSIGPRVGLGPGKVEGKSRYGRHLWALRLMAAVVFSSCEVTTLQGLSTCYCTGMLVAGLYMQEGITFWLPGSCLMIRS